MKLNVNHVALAISLSLAFSSGTAFALPFLSDDDIDTVTSVGRQVADGLQAGTGSRGLQSVSAIPIDTSLLNGHNERSSVLTRSTPRAPINPPVWVPMDPEREELGPGEAPRPKKPRHAKKKKSAHPKRVAKKSSKKSAKLSQVERKLLQHQSALRDQKMPRSKSAKAGKPAEGGHHGNSKSSHSNSRPPPLNKSNHKGKAGKGAPPGKGDHKHPGNLRRSLDENEQMFERDEQDEQTEKAGQAPGQGEPKGDEIEQPKGPQPTLAGMLLPIKRSLWSYPSGDLFIYDRDIGEAVEDARDDDDGNVFWDRDIDDIETRDGGLSEQEVSPIYTKSAHATDTDKTPM
ncbi:hypothetical protein BCV69DRAFT_90620 [Microstroma glucosiphilum]|uniref:Uncharacterized protein n=1 Tax=Pseudomicrostroma glucosiphilum TaxID=1684307 RepID=A0A316U0G8_9BASI|nr:hypothetical protein BCV69DRAFT_90620 [Pseudomicrostroma glucosiphilum]PWN17993.1 hypothetical protein BCV69DRAFT_90620 [Pseudomicrostroma glucosiphilum]